MMVKTETRVCSTFHDGSMYAENGKDTGAVVRAGAVSLDLICTYLVLSGLISSSMSSVSWILL